MGEHFVCSRHFGTCLYVGMSEHLARHAMNLLISVLDLISMPGHVSPAVISGKTQLQAINIFVLILN